MNLLLGYRDLCLESHISDGTVLAPVLGYITPGPTHSHQSYANSELLPELKIHAAIWRLLDDEGGCSPWCFAIYGDEDNEIRRCWTLYAWVTFDYHQIPDAIKYWIEIATPKHPVQLDLFQSRSAA